MGDLLADATLRLGSPASDLFTKAESASRDAILQFSTLSTHHASLTIPESSHGIPTDFMLALQIAALISRLRSKQRSLFPLKNVTKVLAEDIEEAAYSVDPVVVCGSIV